jgi:hypothetical protein
MTESTDEESWVVAKAEFEQIFVHGSASDIREALVFLAMNEKDWRWIQDKCLAFTSHDDATIRSVAATCLGHLARIHKQLDLERVLPRLEALLKDPATAGYAETALDDVNHFLRNR